jgi:hypothetical protein
MGGIGEGDCKSLDSFLRRKGQAAVDWYAIVPFSLGVMDCVWKELWDWILKGKCILHILYLHVLLSLQCNSKRSHQRTARLIAKFSSLWCVKSIV